MDSSTRERALRAAARLAVGVSFGACGGAELTANGALDSGLDARLVGYDASVATSDSSTTSTTDAGWCSLSFEDGGAITPEAKQCCLALTVNSSPVDAGFSFDAGNFRSDPSIKACCQALYSGSGNTLTGLAYGPDHWPIPTCQACADAIDQPVACTPWGPPVPPAMPMGVA